MKSPRTNRNHLVMLIAITALAAPAQQLQQRRASITGNRSDGRGKCTVEIIVDGAAEVEISGDSATIRNLSGQRPQWRRFECTSRMPANPSNFRFSGVEGRGRQELIRDPRNGGGAVIRIEDHDGGNEGYTFDFTWDEGVANNGIAYPNGNRRFPTDQAISACQQAVAMQAAQRFNGASVEFRTTSIDDQPGRNDWVVGLLNVRNSAYRFSCSVNFDNGQIRSAEIEGQEDGLQPMQDDRNRYAMRRDVRSCERAVMEKFRRDQYSEIEINFNNTGQDAWRGERIAGEVRARRRNRTEAFGFSCRLDPRNMNVRSIEVNRQAR